MGPLILRRSALFGGVSLAACSAGEMAKAGVAIETFDVWPAEPPGGEKVTAREEIIERAKSPFANDRAVIHVRTPTLKVFRPAQPDGSAVLIMPGGSYQRVVLDREGDETARRLAAARVTAAVLIYRLPEDGWAAGWQAPLQDAQRAMRLLRSGRVAKRLDPQRIGVLGFSAGGNLAAALTLVEGDAYQPVDQTDQVSSHADFAALIYAAYLDGKGSEALLAGPNAPAPDLIASVTAKAPPMFLVHAADDPSVPVEGSERMHAALQAAGVASELHVFPDAGHGFGIARAKGKQAETWPDLFLAWGRVNGMFR